MKELIERDIRVSKLEAKKKKKTGFWETLKREVGVRVEEKLLRETTTGTW